MGFNRYYSYQPYFEQLFTKNDHDIRKLIISLKSNSDY